MSEPIVKVRDLGKRYRIGLEELANRTFREAVVGAVTAPLRNLRKLRSLTEFGDASNGHGEADVIWALRDINFDVQEGEVVGIIGPNGAGKSTLLKILSRITEPTTGYAEIRGRVSSLLEVGTGFHPELTGRENIYLNGAVLGMGKSEIDRKFDEIVEFSGVSKFLDTPIKRYSSGMQVRLAFSVAAHLEPEVLIVDEVLAVGDAEFQNKCLRKMGEVSQEGRTVLFVSHNLAAIENLCQRTILLENGFITTAGYTNEVIGKYLSDIERHGSHLPISKRKDRMGDGLIIFTSIHWEMLPNGAPTNTLYSGMDYRLLLGFERHAHSLHDQDQQVLVSIGIKDRLGNFVLLNQSDFVKRNFSNLPHRGYFVCDIPRFHLAEGNYSLNLYVGNAQGAHDIVENAAKVVVKRGDFFGTGHPGRPELCRILNQCDWHLEGENSHSEWVG